MKMGYLSGAQRVSTLPDSETLGPKSHILGIIAAATSRGINVDRYIVGDLRKQGRSVNTEKIVRGSRVKTAFVDVARIASNSYHKRRAFEFIREPDFVYERHGAFQDLGRLFLRARIPWIIESNGLFFDEAKRDRNSLTLSHLERRSELNAYRDSDIVIAVSDKLASRIDALLPDRGRRSEILVVPNAVDVEDFQPSGSGPVDRKSMTVIFSGSVVEWQNLDRLIRACAAVSKQTSVRLVIVGSGPAANGLKKLASQVASDSFEVHFAGRVSRAKLVELLSQADIGFCGHLPLKAGVMYHSPLKLYEYLSTGLQVVVPAGLDEDPRLLELPGVRSFDVQDDADLIHVLGSLTDVAPRREDRITRSQFIRENHSWEQRFDLILGFARKCGLF